MATKKKKLPVKKPAPKLPAKPGKKKCAPVVKKAVKKFTPPKKKAAAKLAPKKVLKKLPVPKKAVKKTTTVNVKMKFHTLPVKPAKKLPPTPKTFGRTAAGPKAKITPIGKIAVSKKAPSIDGNEGLPLVTKPRKALNDYRKMRKWTVPKLRPLVEDAAAVRAKILSNKTGPLLASELFDLLVLLEGSKPDWTSYVKKQAVPAVFLSDVEAAPKKEKTVAAKKTKAKKSTELTPVTPEELKAKLASGTLVSPPTFGQTNISPAQGIPKPPAPATMGARPNGGGIPRLPFRAPLAQGAAQ